MTASVEAQVSVKQPGTYEAIVARLDACLAAGDDDRACVEAALADCLNAGSYEACAAHVAGAMLARAEEACSGGLPDPGCKLRVAGEALIAARKEAAK
ncbi:hypothetical protein [Vannielia litorea]|uniref:hypothetical protein n=1 Tax=Vannielia litorea TaxID=1217970 RepID=UPI001C94486C|nr:hypothetical protein [Vannielia litorea]MBY6046919.1 hypothetical protein [Vannielia litorea]MBY6074333.1 hypothetical protein [Vannielia litorea]